MNIKKMIIVCAIIICVLLCMILIIAGTQPKKSNVSDSIESSNEALEMAALETDEEEEEVAITIRNTTGKTIDELYFYGDEIDEDGNLIGRNVIDNPIEDGDSAEVNITHYKEDIKWDITAMTGSGDYEMEYTIGSDFVCDGAVIVLGMQNKKLIVVEDFEEVEEESNSEEEYSNDEENLDEKNEENTENTEEFEEETDDNEENEEENN